ncbi:hypothetical protein ANN_11900 [Periplaneta americana]|uniref:DUF4817 domain-containing protein n=1 Tax=Periplaneta americana TaxID=6978 RepID=A0ABQ8T7S9_PERAM|nr:hypothetical protein ANN_11900 [Periplaneta americana]
MIEFVCALSGMEEGVTSLWPDYLTESFNQRQRRAQRLRGAILYIGRAGPVAWPARSPDLNPLDFYLRSRLKAFVYGTEIPNVVELQQRIENGFETVRNELDGVCNIQRVVRRRSHHCLHLHGRHFEHVLGRCTHVRTFGTSLVEGVGVKYIQKLRSLPSKETLIGHSDSSFRREGYIQCCVGVRLCDMCSNQELAEIHFMYGKADGNAALARRLYQERYPQRQCPDRKTFVRLHYRLCEYGKFNSPGLGRGRPRSTTAEVQEEILEAVNMTPSVSTRKVALQVNVPHTTVWRLLKEYQLYPYHLRRLQALSPADYPARVRFCQWFLQQCGVNPNFRALVLFTDEAQFTRDGITNFHNHHVWAYENPRATVPFHHQARHRCEVCIQAGGGYFEHLL